MEQNTFNLPEGLKLEELVRNRFQVQRQEWIEHVKQIETDWSGYENAMAHAETVGVLELESQPLVPSLRVTQELAANSEMTVLNRARVDVGLREVPKGWYVGREAVQKAAQGAAFALCANSTRTTHAMLGGALNHARDSLAEGMGRGECLSQLTKRIHEVFDQSERYRAKRIARTESMRAHHRGRMDADVESGIVVGKKWLASAGACPLCLTIMRRANVVGLQQPFAKIGDNKDYQSVMAPPAHPNCTCTYQTVLHHDITGEEVSLQRTLINPTPEAEDMPDGEDAPPPHPNFRLGPLPGPIPQLPSLIQDFGDENG